MAFQSSNNTGIRLGDTRANPVYAFGLSRCHPWRFSQVLQALLPKRERSTSSLCPCDASPTTKLKEVKKTTTSRPLPEGYASDLHNMLMKVFQPQKDFPTLVSISEWCLPFSHASKTCFQCTLNGLMNLLALGSCRLCENPCETQQVSIYFSPLHLSYHHPTPI